MKYFIKYTVKTQDSFLENGIADFNTESAKTVQEMKAIVKDWLSLPPSFTASTEMFKLKGKELNDTDTLPEISSGFSYELVGSLPTTKHNKIELSGNTANKKGSKQIIKNG